MKIILSYIHKRSKTHDAMSLSQVFQLLNNKTYYFKRIANPNNKLVLITIDNY